MEVLREILPPRVEDRGDADRAAEVPRVTSEGEQRVGGRAKEERVDDARIALRQRVEVVRQREDDVEVRNRQQVGAARREPPFLGEGLTLGAMAIATGVVGDAHGAAPVTRLPMPAEDGGAAGRDRPERHVLDRREAVRPTIGVAVGAHDVRQLQPRTGDARPPCPCGTAHTISPASGGAKRAEQIERRVRTASPCAASTESSAWSC